MGTFGISVAETIFTSLPSGHGRSATELTAALLQSEPSVANRIFIFDLLALLVATLLPDCVISDKLVISLHCEPVQREKTSHFTIKLSPRSSANAVREVLEIQFAGIAKGHRIPI